MLAKGIDDLVLTCLNVKIQATIRMTQDVKLAVAEKHIMYLITDI